MAKGIGAAGIIGVAREGTPGTYTAPEKYVPVLSEDITHNPGKVYRRPIREVADPVGVKLGDGTFEGDIELEVLHDTFPYFMYGMRGSVAKGGVGPYTYTLTPTHVAEKTGANSTLSITVVRNGVTFGYTGCVITAMSFSLSDKILIATLTIMALNEASQSLPTATWPTTAPFGAGQYDIQVPTTTQVFDVDDFTLDIDESGAAAHRLRDDQNGPTFIAFGERSVRLSLTRDFESRTDYDAFKLETAEAVTVRAEIDANTYWQADVESGIKDSYEVGLDGQGDLVMAEVEYEAVYNDTDSRSYLMEVGTDENIV